MSAAAGALFGKYRLESLLGQGGMGAVWRARHVELGHAVAIKLLAGGDKTAKARDRFLDEARAAAAVKHRNIVGIIEYASTDDGQPFIVMELLEGESLATRLTAGPALSFDEIVRVLSDVLAGLSAVHAAGLIHGDVKPENVILVQDEHRELRGKLIDFGLSGRAQDEDGKRQRISGTPFYMAPEQLRGQVNIDARADVYALGATAFEAFAGHPPFMRNDATALVRAIMQEQAPALRTKRPELGPALCGVIDRALAHDAQDRFASADQMRTALLDAADALMPTIVTADQPGQAVSKFATAMRTLGAELPTPDELAHDPAPPIARKSTRPMQRSTKPTPHESAMALTAPLPASNAFSMPPQDMPSGATVVLKRPERRTNKTMAPWIASGVGVIVLAAFAGWWSKTQPITEKKVPSAALAAPAPAVIAPSGYVNVRLQNLPADGTLLVDREPQTLTDTLRFIADGRAHNIQVRRAGLLEWSTTYVAARDAELSVSFPSAIVPQAQPENAPSNALGARNAAKQGARKRAIQLERDPGF